MRKLVLFAVGFVCINGLYCAHATDSAGRFVDGVYVTDYNPGPADEGLLTAIKNNDFQTVRQLVDSGAEVRALNKNEKHIIFDAIDTGNPDLIICLLNTGKIDMNAYNLSKKDNPLSYLCRMSGKKMKSERDAIKVAKVMLEKGAVANDFAVKGANHWKYNELKRLIESAM